MIYFFLTVVFFLILSYIFSLKIQKNIILFFLVIITIFFVSLRWESGTDWESYYSFFMSQSTLGFNVRSSHFEIGFQKLNYFINHITNNYNVFLFFCSLFSFGLIYKVLRNTPDPLLGYLIFIGHYFPIHYVGSIRRSIALSLIMLIFININHFKKNIFCILIASTFHITSIIALLFIYIKRLKIYNFFTYSCLLIVSLLLGLNDFTNYIFLLLDKIIPLDSNFKLFTMMTTYNPEFIKNYIPDNLNTFYTGIFSFIKKSIFLYFFYKICKRSHDSSLVFLFNVYFIGVILYLAFFSYSILQVLFLYFLLFEVIIVAYSKLYLKKIEYYLFVLYCVVSSYLSYNSAINVFPHLFKPFKTILL